MTWNWQHPGWPDFSWRERHLVTTEQQFLLNGGVFLGTVNHLGDLDKTQLTIEAISDEAMTTSEIEGEVLDRASVQSSIRRQFGLATDHRRIRAAEQGIADMMVDLHRSFADPLTDIMLFHWHRMLTGSRRDLADIGGYRRHPEPMQIVSGAPDLPNIHFEAPPSARIGQEMARFIDWFNRTAPGGATPLPPLTRAGVAHFYFVCIHPFEDGNGRIGRAIAEKALAQGLGRPTLIALAATILIRRKGYYDALERGNKSNEITEWLSWFAATTIEAQKRSLALVTFLIDKTRLLDRVGDVLNERQRKVLMRMLREGPEGFTGGLSAGNYIAISGAAPVTATRDLADMVAKGALVRAGERRYARYRLSISLRPAARLVLDEDGRVVEAIGS